MKSLGIKSNSRNCLNLKYNQFYAVCSKRSGFLLGHIWWSWPYSMGIGQNWCDNIKFEPIFCYHPNSDMLSIWYHCDQNVLDYKICKNQIYPTFANFLNDRFVKISELLSEGISYRNTGDHVTYREYEDSLRVK